MIAVETIKSISLTSIFRLLLSLQVGTVADADDPSSRWSECVEDLWSVQLSHIREETFGDGEFVLDLATNHYGFDNESDNESDWGFNPDPEDDHCTDEEVTISNSTIEIAEEEINNGTLTHPYDTDQFGPEESESKQPTKVIAEDFDCKY